MKYMKWLYNNWLEVPWIFITIPVLLTILFLVLIWLHIIPLNSFSSSQCSEFIHSDGAITRNCESTWFPSEEGSLEDQIFAP